MDINTEHTSANHHISYFVAEHKSGLKIIYYPIKCSQTWANLKVGFGSIDNRFSADGRVFSLPDGTAHFLEHKMFDRADGKDLGAILAANGADANAYTSESETVYMFSCTEKFEDSLEIFLGSVTTPFFTKETVQKEMPIISEEIDMYRDIPDSRLLSRLLRSLYRTHPARNNVEGNKKSIKAVTPEILYTSANYFYTPSNMALCVAGKSDFKKISDICDRVFGTGQAHRGVCKRLPIEEQPTVFRRSVTLYDNISCPKIAIGIKISDIPQDAGERFRMRIYLRMITRILFGQTSVFSLSLCSRRIAVSPPCTDVVTEKDIAYIQLSADCRDPKAFSSEFFSYVDKTLESGIQEVEVEGGRRAMYGAFLSDSDSSEAMSDILLSYAFEGVDPTETVEYMLGITPEKLSEVLKSIYTKDKISVVTMLPKKQDERKTK